MAEKKRLFFGFEVSLALDQNYPSGRVLLEEDRHMTAAFIGSIDEHLVRDAIEELPMPDWKIGLTAISKHLLFLPPKHPRCVAVELLIEESLDQFLAYQKKLSTYLSKKGLIKEEDHPFLPHVTLCRPPFEKKEWSDYFKKSSISISSLHLYESLGSSRYQKMWTFPILDPFEEISHTADIAFMVRGSSFESLCLHAYHALASISPAFLNYGFKMEGLSNLEDLVKALNDLITRLDIEEGSPMKAVSYHGDIEKIKDYFQWVMVVDV